MPTGHSTPSIPVSQCLKLVDAASKSCIATPSTANATTEMPGKDFADTAIAAVNTVEVTATLILGAMAVLLTLAALIGWKEIVRSAKGHAERIANERWAEYITKSEFAELMRGSVDESVERRWQEWVFSHGVTDTPQENDDNEPFPDEPVGP